MKENFTNSDAQSLIKGKLSRYFGVNPENATKDQFYKAIVMSVRDILLEKRNAFNKKVTEKKAKKVYYLCMEFLLGRSLKTSLYNLDVVKAFEDAIKDYGYSLEDMYNEEPDAGLGNGGLGRLAACFMDSLASLNYPAMGFSIRYEYGLFKQKIVDGWQMELPDVWLPGGEVWLTQRTDKTFKVKFDGYVKETWTEKGVVIEHKDAKEVEAVAYDMMISGADSKAVSVLRLWRARNISQFDMSSFSQGHYMNAMQENNEAELISKVLYPADNHFEGKSLRLKQQYFLVSASIQNILRDHKSRYGSLDTLPDRAAIHINDTHPALCIPELMRLLMDENGYSWDKAWDIVTRTVAYTNHTVMSEALEKWSEDLIQRRLPRIYSIIKEINERFCAEMWQKYYGDWDKIGRMSIINHNQIKMANLCVIASHSVNGVSALHSDIIKDSIFKDFYDAYPSKFTNVTNGIAYRRWLNQSNPGLASLLDDCIGHDYYKKPETLKDFKKFANDESVLKRLTEIKQENKVRFANFAKQKHGLIVDPNTLFDVQAKRLHEYKRQLLNAMNIINDYAELLENPDKEMQPKTYIFGAKAAPGYYLAKQIIKLICYISQEINKNPKIKEKLNVVYLEDYCVTTSELLMPASEISEQISLAGKEASGTGNMKFMINGALTVGTLDGANVEILDAVGKDNIFIFGLTTPEVEEVWKQHYSSSYFYNQSAKLKRIIDMLNRGFNGCEFKDIARYLLTNTPVADPYMCMADFESYYNVQQLASETYKDKNKWARMSLMNIAGAGIFAADRSIKDYAKKIWNLKPLNIK